VIALDWLTFHAGLGQGGLQAAAFAAWSLVMFAYLPVCSAKRPTVTT
jgi:hypothetical protein